MRNDIAGIFDRHVVGARVHPTVSTKVITNGHESYPDKILTHYGAIYGIFATRPLGTITSHRHDPLFITPLPGVGQ